MRRTSLAVCTLLFAFGCGADAADAAPASADSLAQEERPSQSFLTSTVTGKVGTATLSGTLSIRRFFSEGQTISAIGQFSDVTGVPADVAKALTAQTIKLPVWVAPEGGFPTDGSEPFCEMLTLIQQPIQIDLDGTVVTIDETSIDINATPGGGAVLAAVLCIEPNLFAGGGRLNNLLGDPETPVAILNGLTGLAWADVPFTVPTLAATAVSDAAQPTGDAATPVAPVESIDAGTTPVVTSTR